MLSQLTILLENKSEKKITLNMSSVFHGVMMELLGENTAAWLHSGKINPYAQYIQYKDDRVQWIISTTTKEAYEKIICPLMEMTKDEIYLSYHKLSLKILEKNISSIKKDIFLRDQYFCNYDRYFKVRFITPSSFKSKGQYKNYPTLRWIFQSLMNKHDFVNENNKIYDEDVLELLDQNCVISNYKLSSTYFYLEGVKIPAFFGNITIHVRENQSIVNLVNYLLMFGEYTGIGMKASMGMGAIKVEHKEKKEVRL